MSEELVKHEDQLPAELDYGEHAGDGYAGQSADDIQLPILNLLQALSPQCQEGHEARIDGATPGMLMNSVTQEVYGKELIFIPAYKERCVNEWVSRKHGGGFVTRHDEGSELYNYGKGKFGKVFHPEDPTHELVETVYLYSLLERENPEMVVLSFSSTKLSPFKKWNTTTSMLQVKTKDGRRQNPPIYAHRVRLRTQSQTNARKETFFNVVLEPAEVDLRCSLLLPSDPRFKAALDLREMVMSGAAKVVEETDNPTPAEHDGGGAY
jgi:hypothetical protein